jgi:Transposase DDE domain
LAAKVTGIVDATDLEATAAYEGCGQVTRKRKITDKRGMVHEIEVTVYGWKLIVLIEARTKILLAATVVPIQEHEMLSLRALVTQARTNLSGHARPHKVVFDRWFLDEVDLWWLDQRGITFVVPARDKLTVTVDARTLAAAGEGITIGRRVQTVRSGQGKTARSERLETEVVGIAGLTTYDPYGTPEHGRHHSCQDFQPNPINAVVVRMWHGRDYGPGGQNGLSDQCPGGQALAAIRQLCRP